MNPIAIDFTSMPIGITSAILLGIWCVGMWVWMGKKGWLTMEKLEDE